MTFLRLVAVVRYLWRVSTPFGLLAASRSAVLSLPTSAGRGGDDRRDQEDAVEHYFPRGADSRQLPDARDHRELDTGRYARRCTMTAELDEALASEVGRAEALAEHLAHRLADLSLADLSAGEPRELYALSIIAQHIHEKHTLIREMAKALLESGGRQEVPPKPPVSQEDKAMLSAMINDLQILVLERPSVLTGLAALVRQLVLNRVV